MSKINVSIRPFNLKLKFPFGISRGTITYAKNVLVKLSFGDLVAFGEAAPSIYYGEDQGTVSNFLKMFLEHRSLEDYLANINFLKDDLNQFEKMVYRGSSASARAALEIAFWDLMGKVNKKSIHEFFFQDDPFLINGSTKSSFPKTSYTIGLDNLLVVETKVKEAINKGFKILKVKLGTGYENDLIILKTIKNLTKNIDCILRVDANGGWDLDTTKKMLNILPEYKVEVLEQPLPKGNILALSELLNESSIPIIVDEDCLISSDVEKLIGKVHGVNIKLMKCGSLLEAFNMINLAKAYNLKVMFGCMIESSCAISAAVHLSPLVDYVDLDGHLLLEKDPFVGLTCENSQIIPSWEDGLGVTFSDL